MRNSFAIAAVLAFVASGAIAQTQNPPARTARRTAHQQLEFFEPTGNRSGFWPQQLHGREAKSRIEKMGFSNVHQT